MTDRDRLIDLLSYFADGYNAENRHIVFDTKVCDVADYLLANGVIVPPCKVGDKVYRISRNKVKECEVVFIGISADEKCSYFNFVENYADGTFYKSYSMVFDVIGKTVFLTKEEAEKALKEREQG